MIKYLLIIFIQFFFLLNRTLSAQITNNDFFSNFSKKLNDCKNENSIWLKTLHIFESSNISPNIISNIDICNKRMENTILTFLNENLDKTNLPNQLKSLSSKASYVEIQFFPVEIISNKSSYLIILNNSINGVGLGMGTARIYSYDQISKLYQIVARYDPFPNIKSIEVFNCNRTKNNNYSFYIDLFSYARGLGYRLVWNGKSQLKLHNRNYKE